MAKMCPKAGACGACRYNGVKYSNQLDRKQELVDSLLLKYGPVAPIIGMEDPFFYRNKVQSVFGYGARGEVVSGIYREGTHKLIPVRDCMLEDKEADAVLATIRDLVKRFQIPPYDEDMGTGAIRHVLIRRAVYTNQTLVVFVSGSHTFRPKDAFIRELVKIHPSVKTVLLNINDKKTSMVLSDGPCKVLYGDGYVEDTLCGLRFRISAKSFYQVNPSQAAKLYTIAMRMARFSGNETVIDAYCGTGTIGLVAASWGAGHVTGIELNPDAVEDAKANAVLNDLTNADFICGDASVVMKQMAKEGRSADVVFMDPPRSGSDERFLASVIKLSPKTVVYISCNPETLARDLRYLTSMGPYRMVGAQPVDMFPQTEHVECVCLIERV
ncbi:MAG: 23S rRNA (uracil(1939)-C(5))-methyltransferase RlmD [Sphaerochaetaceae bacterium]|nr:23S rRNA (uracil(1939)-C(5))-methyltransferase RlmD [Sphaerochaetaceae bacterium]